MNIFLYGPPGSGKTTVGHQLAKNINQPFLDLDDEIERRAGISIPDIFTQEGESGFRRRERQSLEAIVPSFSGVIALGGGTLLDENNRQLVTQKGKVVCLHSSIRLMIERLKNSTTQRPLVNQDVINLLPALYQNRESHYNSFELIFENNHNAVHEIVWRIQTGLGYFYVRGMDRGYYVIAESGGINKCGNLLREIDGSNSIVVITDENVGDYYFNQVFQSFSKLGYLVNSFIIPAGEQSKTIKTVQEIWRSLIKSNIERSSTIIALGGGVVGDITGFAAATYMRGVNWVLLPTSLLAMVDSSLGGKTAIDLPEGKNLVGSFHSPKLVITDIDVLNTLPDTEIRNGLVETFKAGLIGDLTLLDMINQGWDFIHSNWSTIVKRAIAVKIKIIEEDPFEKNQRAVLNLGHTIGHALEWSSHYQLPHGHAVAIGLIVESRIAEMMGFAKHGLSHEIKSMINELGIPLTYKGSLSVDELLKTMLHDKKKMHGKLKIPMLIEPGNVKAQVIIDDLTVINKALNEYLQREFNGG